jgi:FKBP-type peptidyl-prolyl cis-trans isomerase FkpA
MKFTLYKAYSILALIILIVSSCEKEYESIEQVDEKNIQAYIKQNSLSVQQYNNTGIYYKILSPGTGAPLNYNQQVPLIFTMQSLDGKSTSVDTIFNNRYLEYLGYLSPEGLLIGVKEILKNSRGQIRLIVPSRLAFGRNGNKTFPGNTSIDMTVRVLDLEALPAYNDFVIKQFLQSSNLTGFNKTASGIYYKIADPGTGTSITTDSKITATYTGKLLNGKIFDTQTDSPFYLQSLIPGWLEIIPLIKVGGSVRFILPSGSAYGNKNSGTIPPFSCLDFDVKVSAASN